jgi:hypothetical protein
MTTTSGSLKAMINSDIRVNQHQPVDQRDTHH